MRLRRRPDRKQLTSGRFEIDTVQLSPDGATFYIQSNEQHPGERHLYALSVDGGARTKLTTATGSFSGEVSPDNTTFAVVHSAASKPPEVYLMPNRAGAEAQGGHDQLVGRMAIVQVGRAAVDHIQGQGRCGGPRASVTRRRCSAPSAIRRTRRSCSSTAPAICRTRTATGRRITANTCSTISWLPAGTSFSIPTIAPAPATVAIGGRRSTAGWVARICEDVVDGAKYVTEVHKVDPKRIGVYGGSYGGFITLMAMFTSPDTFAAGAALRPVTDWAHYNHSYTSNILNEPQGDIEAYRKSSPIYFAEGLKGALLICHGMVDVNVHFQDSVRLAQRLIELRKENWELAVYPVEDHGFVEETSWADEYKRILMLFENNLKGNGHVRRTN